MDSRFLNVVVNGDSMWPGLPNGSMARFERIDTASLEQGMVILLDHPFRKDLKIIKRIKSISEDKMFITGDNPDPTASEDSHNFGLVPISLAIARHSPQ